MRCTSSFQTARRTRICFGNIIRDVYKDTSLLHDDGWRIVSLLERSQARWRLEDRISFPFSIAASPIYYAVSAIILAGTALPGSPWYSAIRSIFIIGDLINGGAASARPTTVWQMTNTDIPLLRVTRIKDSFPLRERITSRPSYINHILHGREVDARSRIITRCDVEYLSSDRKVRSNEVFDWWTPIRESCGRTFARLIVSTDNKSYHFETDPCTCVSWQQR